MWSDIIESLAVVCQQDHTKRNLSLESIFTMTFLSNCILVIKVLWYPGKHVTDRVWYALRRFCGLLQKESQNLGSYDQPFSA